MEEVPDVMGNSSNHTQTSDYPVEDIMAVQELSQSQSVQDNTTIKNTTEPEQNSNHESEMEEEDNLPFFDAETDHSNSINTHENVISNESSYSDSKGGLDGPNNQGRFICHTSTLAHAYFMWHLSKYCCSANEPNWEDKMMEAEELFDDCLNYLECSDVLTDYANELWQSSLLDNDRVLLATDEGDETKVSQDSLNGCDPLLSGITCVNEVSYNTLAMDASPSPCVSHSEPTEEAVKKDLSRDSETEMVITVGHQQDEISSVKNKERCKLAAIQNDQAGIEEENKENTLRGNVSIHSKNNTFVDLYHTNLLDNSVKTMMEDPMELSIIQTCSENGKGKLDDKTFALLDDDSPGIPTENCSEGLNHYSVNNTPDPGPNDSELFSRQNEEEFKESECPQLTTLFIDETDTDCSYPTDHCEEDNVLVDNASQTPINHHKIHESTHDIFEQPSGLSKTEDTSIFTNTQESDKTTGCFSDQDIHKSDDTVGNEIEEPISELAKTNIMPKTVFVCPLHKSRNIQKDICTTCIEEKLNQIQVEQLCKAKKEAILENVHPEKSSPVKCKKQDSLDDGYHSLGMSCDQHYFDDKYQKERGCIMMDSKKYMENMDDDAEFPKRDGLTNKMHLNKLDNTKTHQHKIKKNDGKLKTSNIKDMPTNLDMVNDKVCLANCEQTKTTGLSNNHTLDSLASDSKGKVINKNKMKQHLKGEPSKRKVLECPSQNKKNCTLNNDGDQLNITLENHQKSTCKKPLSYQNDKPKSAIKPELLVASTTFLDSKTTENGALSLNAMEHIPNSKEHICKNTGTIKTRASNIKEDLIKNGQCPASSVECKLSMSGSSHPGNLTNSHEKSVENKAAKKKLKVLGKEHNKISKCNEKEKLAGEEVLVMEEENNDRPERATVKDNKLGPRLLRSIEADMFPDNPGNMKLHCQFGEIHADSTVTWTKDSKLLARIHRSSKDDSPVSLAIVQTSKQDQGLYHCNLKNIYGKVSTEFLLTSEVLDPLTCYQDFEGGEEIEFNQLLFREDFISDMYFGGNIQGRIATEDLHFGEGVHRKAFRSKVMCGLLPVFNPGHLCVLKVHNAIAYGTKTNDELVQKNYKLAVQECHVQNTAREYAKIYAAEAEQLEDFGIVPEIIPVFLIHRPANNIPYATVEEELIGEFVKYSIRDGKEINFLRRDSEAGQKCCTFQHWVYEKTSGNLLVTDMQGVGMKLTDVGIATIAKGYKGFKGNCSVSFIDQFKALHLCNKYCEILGLKSLKPQKQKKPIASKEKVPPASPTTKKSKQLTKPKNKT